MKILDIGCGKKKYKSESPEDTVIGIDNVELPGVDVVHDLEKIPLPFNNDEFDMVICSYIFEHVRNFCELMGEIERVAKPDAIIKITVPFYSSWGQYSDLLISYKGILLEEF